MLSSSRGMIPAANSTACSKPGGLLWPPPDRRPFSVDAVIALADFRLTVSGVGHDLPAPPSPRTASVRDVPGCAADPGVFLDPDALPSPCVGVGQLPCLAIVPRLGLPADGRGFSTDPEGVVPPWRRTPLSDEPYSVAAGVG